jgi:hypothetical protein
MRSSDFQPKPVRRSANPPTRIADPTAPWRSLTDVSKEPDPNPAGTPTAPDWRPGILAGGPESSVSLIRRFSAWLIDWLLCLLVGGFFIVDRRYLSWAAGIVLIVEYTFFIGLFTQTPGYWIARIRCVSGIGGSRIGVARAFVRAVLLALVIPALLGWHNRAAESVVEPATKPAEPV